MIRRRSLKVHLDHYALDNGAWLYHVGGVAADFGLFKQALETMGKDADWCVVPDVVAGGTSSLALSERWLPDVLEHTSLALIPVQDGMTTVDLEPLVGPRVGLFVGGSTAWKWTHAHVWAHFAHEREIYIHVGRVNTRGRADHCANLGIHSADGSSVSRFSITASRFKEATSADRHAQIHLRLGP